MKACACALALLLPAAASAAVSVEASVDATRVGTEDLLYYTVTISDSSLGEVREPDLPDLQGFQVVGRTRQQGYKFELGRSSVSLSWTYTLAPPGPGDYLFDPAVVRYDGREYRTNPIKVSVVSGAVKKQRGGPGSLWDPFNTGRPSRERTVRLVTEISGSEAWVGEAIVLTYRLQSTLRLVRAQPMAAPEFPGFLVQEYPTDDRARRVGEEGGQPLYEHVLARYVLIPLEAGDKGIPAIDYHLEFRVPEDAFGIGLFDRSEQYTRRGDAKVVKVRPLPTQGMPPDFAGAVGHFSLEASLSGNRGQQGEAMSLRLSLSGSGNFPQLGPPKASALNGFKVYEPKTDGEVQVTEHGLDGRKSWEYVLVPLKGGLLTVPEYRFSYFDPGAGIYRTARTRPLTVDVAPSPVGSDREGGTIAAGGGDGGSAPSADPFFLQPLEDSVAWLPSRPYATWWYWTLAGVPLLWLAAVGAARLGESGREEREERRRIRRARASALSELRRARSRMRDDAAFFAAVEEALLGYFADRTGSPPAALGRERVQSILREGGAPEGIRREIAWIQDSCDHARFAPGAADPARKKEVLARASKVLPVLDRFVPGRASRGPGRGVPAAVLLCLLLPAASLRAEPPGQEGMESFARGDYARAAEIYRGLLDDRRPSAALHHDLAVALFRSGRKGEAILHLEKAVHMEPGNLPARNALDRARADLGLPPPSEGLFERLGLLVGRYLSPDEAAVAALALWWLAAGAAAVRIRRPDRPWAGRIALTAAGTALLPAALLALRLWTVGAADLGVLLDSAGLRSGPSGDFPVLEESPEGAEGRILKRGDGWIQIRLPSGLTGWVPAGSVGVV